ncbi:MAG: DUF4362 domain-containing protein [Bacteroidetes bacterium]|nr:DUF4362 domain-containing protein [Bacteroidota bacterium]
MKNLPTLILLLIVTELFSQIPLNSKGENKNRVIINLMGITNESRFILFKDNLNKNMKDKFEIYRYTKEGAPIITKVKFNGKTVVIKTNRRKDKYASRRFKISKLKVSTESIRKANTIKELIDLKDEKHTTSALSQVGLNLVDR